MNPRQFIREYQARVDALNANRAAEVGRVTFDLLAQVRLRVQSQGQNFRGQPFAPYTRDYAHRRAKAGYQVGYVDFTRTGRLWASVRPTVVDETRTAVTVQVAASTATDRDKLRGAVRKRGNILTPSKDEIAIAAESNRRRILKYLGA